MTIFNIFKKNTFPQLESFFLKETQGEKLTHYSWMALAINQRTISHSMLTKELVLTPRDSKTPGISIQIAEVEKGLIEHVHFGSKKIFSGSLNDEAEIKNARVLFNNLVDSVIQKEIKFFTTKMEESSFNPRQLENEEKGLEWMRVSFEMLTKAAMESLTNPEFLFQTTFFCGTNPKTNKREMRLITFNLDMTFYLLDDNNLRVLIYNKKPGDKDPELKAALMGDYSFRKREIFDQFIILLSALSRGIHA